VSNKELFKLPRRRRQHAQTKYVADRLTAWIAGGETRESLVREVLADPQSIHRDSTSTESANLLRCKRLAREDGQFGKAVRALNSFGVADPSSDVSQALQEKHPEGPEIQLHEYPTASLQVQDEDVLAQLSTFPKGTGCGRSGWLVNHFIECSSDQTGVPQFKEQLTALVNLFLSGKASA
jgi:hypothetical protein